MSGSCLITDATIFKHGRPFKANILIENGKIRKISKVINYPLADEEIDAKGLIATPGFIDPHVHLRDLEYSYKEDFYSGTCAAAAGGFTTVLDMPNTSPPTDSPERLIEKIKIAAEKIVTHVGFHGTLVASRSKIEMFKKAGAVSLKLYMHKPLGGYDPDDNAMITDTFAACKTRGMLVSVHAEERRIIDEGKQAFSSKETSEAGIYLIIHKPEAETMAVQRIISIAAKTKTKLHFCHISCEKSLDIISRAKKRGLSVSCEATPHHILLDKRAFQKFGTMAICDPPIRGLKDVGSLRRALANGIVDMIGTDHAPHALQEKTGSSVLDVRPGLPGLETAVPLLLTLVRKGGLSLERMIHALSTAPSSRFGLLGKGRLQQGYDADITLLDLRKKIKIDASKFYSRAKYSLFDGYRCVGAPVVTMVRGSIAMRDGHVMARPGSGSIVRADT